MVPQSSAERMSAEQFKFLLAESCEEVIAASLIDPVARHEELTRFVSTLLGAGMPIALELQLAEAAPRGRSPSIPTVYHSACVKTSGDPLPARQ